MACALVICQKGNLRRGVIDLLREMAFNQIEVVASGAQGRRRMQEINCDLVIINTPLEDEFGTECALDLQEDYEVGIILLVKSEMAEAAADRLAGTAAFVVTKPISRTVLAQHISLLVRTQRRVTALTRKVEDLQRKLADQKIIFRGKLVLMGHLDISEAAAHRYLQKKAMDLRMKPAEVAERIIATVIHEHS